MHRLVRLRFRSIVLYVVFDDDFGEIDFRGPLLYIASETQFHVSCFSGLPNWEHARADEVVRTGRIVI